MRKLPALALIAVVTNAAEVDRDIVRSAAQRAVALVQASQKDWFSKQTCASCHHQFLPALAFRDARGRGITVNEPLAHLDAAKAFSSLANLDRAVQYTHVIDPALDDAYRLLSAEAAGVRPSLATAMYARLIASRQKSDGHWGTIDVRPPQSASFVTATAVGLRAIQIYHHPSLAHDTGQRVDRARRWLAARNARDTEERAYQLLGLRWAGAARSELAGLAEQLAATQQQDGGWTSVSGRASDAYSTGQALVALHDAGGIPASDPRWLRGVRFLLDTQRPDGSWHVVSRMVSPVQVSPPYFETGYPHGHDQFISASGACWAVMALSRAFGPAQKVEMPSLREAEPARIERWMETVLFGSAGDLRKLLANHFNPNSATKDGTTALMMAIPDVEKTRLLLDHGAKVNARAQTRYSALLVAAQYPDSLRAIELLLARGAQLRLPKGAGAPLFNATALGLAVMAGNAKAVPLFLSKGDRFDEKFVFVGIFPGLTVVTPGQGDDIETLRALLDAGLPVDFADDAGITLLGWAVISNRLNAARLLIHRGADVNHVDALGMMPLQHAASIDFGQADMIDLFRKAGARQDARTKEGLTALDLARKYHHTNLLESLNR